jgi:hypothetical protein
MSEAWTEQQMTPMSMFELGARWTDALKVIGAGNGAGVLAAGSAISALSGHANVVPWLKIGGGFFFVGLICFAVAFFLIHRAVFAFDDMLHATRRKDVASIDSNAAASSRLMQATEHLANIGSIAFLLGCAMGGVAFFRF